MSSDGCGCYPPEVYQLNLNMMFSNKNFLFQGTFFSGVLLVFGGGGRFLEVGMCLEVGDVLLISFDYRDSTVYSIVCYSFSIYTLLVVS